MGFRLPLGRNRKEIHLTLDEARSEMDFFLISKVPNWKTGDGRIFGLFSVHSGPAGS